MERGNGEFTSLQSGSEFFSFIRPVRPKFQSKAFSGVSCFVLLVAVLPNVLVG